MMSKIKITQKRNNSTEIIISGELTIYTVLDIYQQHIQQIKLKELVSLKLAGVEEIDTAGMQLLLVLFKEVSKQNANYIVQSISDSLTEYINLFNLQSYFNSDEVALEGNK
jgi:anti-anti-sigma factor